MPGARERTVPVIDPESGGGGGATGEICSSITSWAPVVTVIVVETSWLAASEYLAGVVMKLPAWYAALHEARAHVAMAAGERSAAREHFDAAARGFGTCGQPLDAAASEGIERAG